MQYIHNLILVLFLGAGSSLLAQNPDNKGTEFYLAFGSNYSSNSTLQLFLTSDVTTLATIRIGSDWSTQESVTPGTVKTVDLPSSTTVRNSGQVEAKGVHITAEAEISVYGLNLYQFTTDAFLALPVDVLGTDYVILSYGGGGGSFLVVAGTMDGTTITVTPTTTTMDGQPAGTPFDVSLDAGEAVAYYAYGDLTGSIVSADQPIAVFGGNICTNVPSNASACDHLVEQLPPISTWGNQFVTYPLATRTRSIFYRFVAQEDDTTITIDIDNDISTAESWSLDRGGFIERDYLPPSVVTANKPILVGQYSPGSSWDGVTSDPFMVIVPPFEQFGGTTTVINVPVDNFSRHYVNIVAPNTAIGNVFLDGVAISPEDFVAIGSSGFSGAALAVTGGSHSLASNIAFGVTAYGFGEYDSYGYPGGMLLGDVANVDQMDIISLDDSAPIFSEFCAVAKVTDREGQPLVGIRVDFTVSGANEASGFGTTDADGEALLCYTGQNPGTDTLTAYAQLGALQDTTTIDWYGLSYELWPKWNLIYLGIDLPSGEVYDVEGPAPNTPAGFFGQGFYVYRLEKTFNEASGRPQYTYHMVMPDEPLVGGTAYWVYNPGTEKVTIDVEAGTLVQANTLDCTTAWNMTGTTLGITGLPVGRPVLSVLIWDGIRQRYVPAPQLEGQHFWDFVTGVFIYVTEDIQFSLERE